MDVLFLDANILFAAAYRQRAGLTCLWKLEATKLVTSEYAFEEALRNLDEGAQHRRLRQLMKGVSIFPMELASSSSWDASLPAKDRPILNAAVAAGATHLLTLDERHFGPLYGAILGGALVMHPRDYLKTKQRAENAHEDDSR